MSPTPRSGSSVGPGLRHPALPPCARSNPSWPNFVPRSRRGSGVIGGVACGRVAADHPAEHRSRPCWPAWAWPSPGPSVSSARWSWISGNLPFKTEVASSWIYSLSQSDELAGGGCRVGRPDRHRSGRSPGHRRRSGAASTSPRRYERRPLAPARCASSRSGYVLLLIALPVGFVFYRAFQHGLPGRLGCRDHPRRPARACGSPLVVVLIAVTA